MNLRLVTLSLTGFVTIGFVISGLMGILDLMIVKTLLFLAFFAVCGIIIHQLIFNKTKKPSQN